MEWNPLSAPLRNQGRQLPAWGCSRGMCMSRARLEEGGAGALVGNCAAPSGRAYQLQGLAVTLLIAPRGVFPEQKPPLPPL